MKQGLKSLCSEYFFYDTIHYSKDLLRRFVEHYARDILGMKWRLRRITEVTRGVTDRYDPS